MWAGHAGMTRGAKEDEFSFHRYVKNVDVKRLIESNTVFDEAKNLAIPPNASCNLCNSVVRRGESVRLSNSEFICESCFREVQTIRYPQTYQDRYECYLVEKEARKLALEAYEASLPVNKRLKRLERIERISATLARLLTFLAGVLLLTGVLKTLRVFVTTVAVLALIWTIRLALARLNSRLEALRNSSLKEWGVRNPEPQIPELKHFHDPTAILTNRDRTILNIFDYWPGYPPYWTYVRDAVKRTDGDRCQVTGCPSRTELHVHHKTPISQGGSHRIENLVTLCIFHHGLQPDMGHERVWGEIQTRYFSMVAAHYRGGHPVRAHVRRKELASAEVLNEIAELHEFTCPECSVGAIIIGIDSDRNTVRVSCLKCSSEWLFDQKLPEETGPQMAKIFRVNSNPGRWQIDWGLMETIRKPTYRKVGRSSAPTRRKQSHQALNRAKPSRCPRCGKLLKLRTGRHGEFLGCSGYPDCTFTRNVS